MADERAPTYWDYLKLERLLALQGGLGEDEEAIPPDELHFIIIHQAYELWFKLVLSELRLARDKLAQPAVSEEQIPGVVNHLRRVTEILRLLVEQLRVMETMAPQDFLAFRDKLVPASGFQSFQLREIEILLGLEDRHRTSFLGRDPLEHIRGMSSGSASGERAWARIEAARCEVTLRTCLQNWLHRTPIQGSQPENPGDEQIVRRFAEDYLAAGDRLRESEEPRLATVLATDRERIHEKMQAAGRDARSFLFAEDSSPKQASRLARIRAALLFIESYRELPLLAWPRLLIDSVVEFEENLVIWRHRHARMVERIIGRRLGTGGSAGVEYLDDTAKHRIFDELWAVRTQLLPQELRPPLQNAKFYYDLSQPAGSGSAQ